MLNTQYDTTPDPEIVGTISGIQHVEGGTLFTLPSITDELEQLQETGKAIENRIEDQNVRIRQYFDRCEEASEQPKDSLYEAFVGPRIIFLTENGGVTAQLMLNADIPHVVIGNDIEIKKDGSIQPYNFEAVERILEHVLADPRFAGYPIAYEPEVGGKNDTDLEVSMRELDRIAKKYDLVQRPDLLETSYKVSYIDAPFKPSPEEAESDTRNTQYVTIEQSDIVDGKRITEQSVYIYRSNIPLLKPSEGDYEGLVKPNTEGPGEVFDFESRVEYFAYIDWILNHLETTSGGLGRAIEPVFEGIQHRLMFSRKADAEKALES